MRTFQITRDPYEEKEYLYAKKNIELKPGITVLVGCNGAGKSTLLRMLKRKLEQENVPCLYYDSNSAVDGAAGEAVMRNDFQTVASMMMGSEGEKIKTRAATFASNLGYFALRQHAGAKELWILIDSIDSGFSIDNIIDLKRDLFGTVLDSTKGKDVYIVVSANSYEMAAGEQCYDVQSCKYRAFSGYNTYRNFVLKSREKRDKIDAKERGAR